MLAVEVLVKFLLLFSQKVPPLYLTSFMRGSYKLWKSWKTWKITKKSSMHGKIMEFIRTWIIMEKSWNFRNNLLNHQLPEN